MRRQQSAGTGRSPFAEYRRLKAKSRTLAVLWLCAHYLSQLALVGIVLAPLLTVAWLTAIARGAPPGGAARWWALGAALLSLGVCGTILVCSVALRSHLAKRGGAMDWDK